VQDTVRNMRFSINFFTSIGLGGLTDNMREHLANMPKIIAAQQAAALAAARAEVLDCDPGRAGCLLRWSFTSS
jgi:pre-mRNA-splicing factor CWC22